MWVCVFVLLCTAFIGAKVGLRSNLAEKEDVSFPYPDTPYQ